jgi:hypothetical protein
MLDLRLNQGSLSARIYGFEIRTGKYFTSDKMEGTSDAKAISTPTLISITIVESYM